MCVLQWFWLSERRQRMVHHSWKSPPAPDVQPAHQTLKPVMSSHFRNRRLTFSPASLPHTQTHTHTKCHKWLLSRETKAGKSTTQTLMKNKSLQNPFWKECKPNMHHSFLTANPLLASHHPIVSSHTCACFSPQMHIQLQCQNVSRVTWQIPGYLKVYKK